MTMKQPPFRKLRGYAFDPSLSLKTETVEINNIIYKVLWEDNLEPGPIGDYIEVVDYDPTIDVFYKAVDLNEQYILAQDGLAPSESNPQFHQQMVYAVTMLTIKNFEKALGRKIIWAPRKMADGKKYEEYVSKLRVYPHALRDSNAYYSPQKKALLFGYFSSTPADETLNMPDSLVFTCLSHDIIAHETTHAILDGMHNQYNQPTNQDMLAFHEAFADIVALFQHFTFPEVLKHQIAKTKGDLNSQSLLGQLAQEFGSAIGSYGSLRDAIGEVDEVTKTWKPKLPNPDDYRTITEPHERGSILVAAIFEAFITIYKRRVADLIRIASGGSGILQEGELHPDLVGRLAGEAAKAADHVLRMCIRALDYCPPVDLTFGDYLRAIITSDSDLVEDDSRAYRLAFIDAFRRRGIYPESIRTLSIDSLRFPVVNIGSKPSITKPRKNTDTQSLLVIISDFLRSYGNKIRYENNREEIFKLTKLHISGDFTNRRKPIQGLHQRISNKFSGSEEFARLTGLVFDHHYEAFGISRSKRFEMPSFQIQNLRLVSRVGPNGNQLNQVVFSLIQRSGVVFKDDKFDSFFDLREDTDRNDPTATFLEFCGGCTLIFDLDSSKLQYVITKPLVIPEIQNGDIRLVINRSRLEKQYRFQYQNDAVEPNEFALYFSNGSQGMTEPFAFLHQH